MAGGGVDVAACQAPHAALPARPPAGPPTVHPPGFPPTPTTSLRLASFVAAPLRHCMMPFALRLASLPFPSPPVVPPMRTLSCLLPPFARTSHFWAAASPNAQVDVTTEDLDPATNAPWNLSGRGIRAAIGGRWVAARRRCGPWCCAALVHAALQGCAAARVRTLAGVVPCCQPAGRCIWRCPSCKLNTLPRALPSIATAALTIGTAPAPAAWRT